MNIFTKKKKNSISPDMTPEEKTEANIKRKTRLIKQLKHDAVFKIVGFILMLYITFAFIFGVTLAPTNDMYPAIHKGDLIVFYRLGRIINADVVLYTTPDGEAQIGRVQATQGEVLGSTNGKLLTINGNIQPVQKRSGLYDETYTGSKDISGEVGKDQFLVLGDLRETALDSREYGLISRKDIKGKAFTIIRRRPL